MGKNTHTEHFASKRHATLSGKISLARFCWKKNQVGKKIKPSDFGEVKGCLNSELPKIHVHWQKAGHEFTDQLWAILCTSSIHNHENMTFYCLSDIVLKGPFFIGWFGWNLWLCGCWVVAEKYTKTWQIHQLLCFPPTTYNFIQTLSCYFSTVVQKQGYSSWQSHFSVFLNLKQKP